MVDEGFQNIKESKEYEIFKYMFNETCIGSVYWKLQNADQRKPK